MKPVALVALGGGALAGLFVLTRSPGASAVGARPAPRSAPAAAGVAQPPPPAAPSAGDLLTALFSGAATSAPGVSFGPGVSFRAPTRRDFTPQFANQAAYNQAVRLNPDPRHLIPHMDVQEGHAIKYEDIRGGSDTIVIP